MKGKKHLLIVDDDPINIMVLNNLLEDKYKISAATSGLKALKLIFEHELPDMILLDIVMPEMDGYEVFRRINANEKTKNIPVIFITAKHDIEDEKRCFELGAVDYFTKPIQPMIVQPRINTHLQLYEQRKLLQIEKDQNDYELDLANKIQKQFIPDKSFEIPGYEIKSLFKPLRAIGGDYFDYYSLDENSMGIILADVMGHGIPAALITSMIRILGSLINEEKPYPGKFMTILNNDLENNIFDNFVTAIYGVLSAKTNTFTFANAAHCMPLVYKHKSATIDGITVCGKILGMMKENNSYLTEEILLEKNDMIFLITDGVVESIENNYKMGMSLLKDMILNLAKKSLDEIIISIFEQIKKQLEKIDKPFSDDITIIGIRRTC